MKNRLSRMIKPETGRTVMLAVDHGYFMGPTHKLEEPRKTIEPLLAYSDAIMCTRGVLRTSIDPRSNVPIVLRVSGGASIIGDSLTNEAITNSVQCLWLWPEDPSWRQNWTRFNSPTTQFRKGLWEWIWAATSGNQIIPCQS